MVCKQNVYQQCWTGTCTAQRSFGNLCIVCRKPVWKREWLDGPFHMCGDENELTMMTPNHPSSSHPHNAAGYSARPLSPTPPLFPTTPLFSTMESPPAHTTACHDESVSHPHFATHQDARPLYDPDGKKVMVSSCEDVYWIAGIVGRERWCSRKVQIDIHHQSKQTKLLFNLLYFSVCILYTSFEICFVVLCMFFSLRIDNAESPSWRVGTAFTSHGSLYKLGRMKMVVWSCRRCVPMGPHVLKQMVDQWSLISMMPMIYHLFSSCKPKRTRSATTSFLHS